LAAEPASAAVTYVVTVNTTAVNGTSGFLDFQFNPGNGTSQPATATISNFAVVGGAVTGAPSDTGNVTGALPATVTIVNSTALNEAFQGFTYGTSFSFVLTLSGPAIDTPNGTATAGSTFGIGLYDSASNPILTDQGALTGFAGQVDINLNGTNTPTAFPTPPAGPSVVTFQTPNRPTITKSFGLAAILPGTTTSLSFTITNPPGGAPLHVSVTDPLPTGLLVATPNGLNGTCNGTAPTATAGSGTITLAGATLPAGTACTFSVNVVGVTQGSQINTTGPVNTTEGVTGTAATASISVVSSASIPVMTPASLAAFAILLVGVGWFLASRPQRI
jgi:hypothetical protein